jgi:hypothetical protein
MKYYVENELLPEFKFLAEKFKNATKVNIWKRAGE